MHNQFVLAVISRLLISDLQRIIGLSRKFSLSALSLSLRPSLLNLLFTMEVFLCRSFVIMYFYRTFMFLLTFAPLSKVVLFFNDSSQQDLDYVTVSLTALLTVSISKIIPFR